MSADKLSVLTNNAKLKNILSTVLCEGAVFTGKSRISTVNTILTDYITDITDKKYINILYSELKDICSITEISNFYYKNIDSYINRKLKIYDSLREYEKVNDNLNVEGFFIFYLREFNHIMDEIIQNIKIELLDKKEYDSFISLMKALISCQTRIVDNLCIIADNKGRLSFYDDDMRNITLLCKNDFMEEFSEEPICNDEFLMCTVIGLAPEKITIINGEKMSDKKFLEVLADIYEDKIFFPNFRK